MSVPSFGDARGRLQSLNWRPLIYIVVIVLTIAAGVVIGTATAERAYIGLGGAIALLAGVLLLRQPVMLAYLALCGVFVVERIGGSSSAPGSAGGVSYSDFLLAGATVIALPMVLRTSEVRRLRIPLLGLAIYLALLMPTVILNYAPRGDLEWLHRLVLVGGALIVGAWLTIEGKSASALRAFLWVSTAIGILAIVDSGRHGFVQAAAPLNWNKNFLGDMFVSPLVIALTLRRHIDLRPRTRGWMVVVLTAALIVTQSRGAMIDAAVALVVVVMVQNKNRQTRAIVLLLAIGLAIGVGFSIKSQFNATPQQLNLSSIGIRINVEHETQKIWRTSPLVGVGLKYFNSGRYGYFAQAPNNVVDNELAEAGIIGLLGFVALEVAALGAGYRRRREPFVAVAASLVLGRLVHGQLDIFWNAGVSSLPFIILGIALAMPTAEEDASALPRGRT